MYGTPPVYLNMFIWKSGATTVVSTNKSGSQVHNVL